MGSKQNGHAHGEAFALMTYQCEGCHAREKVWNSRDGVTPFGIDCRKCGKTAYHVEWALDRYAPNHQLEAGDRFFRDGTVAEAAAIMRFRLEMSRGTAYELPEEQFNEVIASAVRDDSGEFARGWPHLAIYQQQAVRSA